MKRVITLTGLAMAIGLASMGAQAADYVAGKDYYSQPYIFQL